MRNGVPRRAIVVLHLAPMPRHRTIGRETRGIVPIVEIAGLIEHLITARDKELKPRTLISLKMIAVFNEPSGGRLITITDVNIMMTISAVQLGGYALSVTFLALAARARRYTLEDIDAHAVFAHFLNRLKSLIIHIAANHVHSLIMLGKILKERIHLLMSERQIITVKFADAVERHVTVGRYEKILLRGHIALRLRKRKI